jgi:hypothetical protein
MGSHSLGSLQSAGTGGNPVGMTGGTNGITAVRPEGSEGSPAGPDQIVSYPPSGSMEVDLQQASQTVASQVQTVQTVTVDGQEGGDSMGGEMAIQQGHQAEQSGCSVSGSAVDDDPNLNLIRDNNSNSVIENDNVIGNTNVTGNSNVNNCNANNSDTNAADTANVNSLGSRSSFPSRLSVNGSQHGLLGESQKKSETKEKRESVSQKKPSHQQSLKQIKRSQVLLKKEYLLNFHSKYKKSGICGVGNALGLRPILAKWRTVAQASAFKKELAESEMTYKDEKIGKQIYKIIIAISIKINNNNDMLNSMS